MEVINVENLYKQYRLGQVSTGSIAHDLNRWWYTVRGKEDPYEKITGVNNREENGSNDYVWALQDINFSVKQGEVLGIIGRNGAGKSTLLKILSKVTSPTKGNIKIKGRIASLLEVGTGFHPELTGRENIFLNGAILGMTKSEIRSKFDEIVAFSGVEKYIDTPVKRYSSGMYVRLAFAVAAHLEPEILIVDEVLAVGDAEFQKKCLGKMKDVSGEGRTVLFVSHNMAAVQSLCDNSVYLNKGKINNIGKTNFIINQYLLNENKSALIQHFNEKNENNNEFIKLKKVWISLNDVCKKEHFEKITIKSSFKVNFEFNYLPNKRIDINFSVNVKHISGQIIFNSVSSSYLVKGPNEISCCMIIPENLLNSGIYEISFMVAKERSIPLFYAEKSITIEVFDERDENEKWFGDLSMVLIRPELKWELLKNI